MDDNKKALESEVQELKEEVRRLSRCLTIASIAIFVIALIGFIEKLR